MAHAEISQSSARERGLASTASRIWALAVLVLGCGAALPQEPSATQIFSSASRSVLVVLSLDLEGNAVMQGSGVVVEPNVVVTNCHVLEGGYTVAVMHQGISRSGTLRHMDVPRDVCTITVSNLSVPTATINRSGPVSIGSHVYAIGAPRGLELTLSDGLVSSLRKDENGTYIQTTAPISPGSSGGGLFDDHGRLVGLTTFMLRDSQQLNFALPVKWIDELPSRHLDPVVRA